MMFKKVAIIGTGLIGGSLALAIKRKKLAAVIVGVSRRKSTIDRAKKIGAIDRGSQDLNIAKGADLVIIATPVSTMMKLSQKLSTVVGPDCIVTDVGSTKEEIVSKLSKVFPNFVGAHPLAGSEKSGVTHACPDIFSDSLCIVTPDRGTNKFSLKKVECLWKRLGARVIFMPASQHDRVVALISHLPHAVAFSLIGSIPSQCLKFAANGLKSTTRIACSDPELWSQIFISNKKNLLSSLEIFEKKIGQIKSAIKNSNAALLIKTLKDSQRKREILG